MNNANAAKAAAAEIVDQAVRLHPDRRARDGRTRHRSSAALPGTCRRSLSQVLPEWLAEQVAGVATETQTPVDLAGCIGIAALSTAAGGRAEVAVRGLWREPVNVYVLVALPPGARKSPVFAAMTAPLMQVERELAGAGRSAHRHGRVGAQDRAGASGESRG